MTPIALTTLAWKPEALAPVISAETISFHHGKHHKAYVDKTLELIAGTPLEGKSLEDISRAADNPSPLFNNAAQSWNHDFYWKNIAPPDSSPGPEGALAERIATDFGSLDGLKKTLVDKGVAQFASGWAWLVWQDGRLAVTTTSNADTPMVRGTPCLLTLDVWEHAYYLDYQNRRKDHLEAMVNRLIDWRVVSQRFVAAVS